MFEKYNVFVFARGGSKGITSKNLQLIAGKTLLEHSLLIAQQLGFVDKIYVSSDDDKILSVALSNGAEVIERPKHLATDEVSEWLAWQHAVEYSMSQNREHRGFISLPCTAPLRSVADVEAAVEKFETSGADLCMTIVETNKNPAFNMVKKVDNEFIELVGGNVKQGYFTRQSAPKVYEITTVAYITSNEFILNNDKIFDGTIVGSEVPRERAVDIDDLLDLEFARFLFEHSNKI